MTVKLTAAGCEIISPHPLVVKNLKEYFHIHSYGGLTPFFEGLRAGRLMGTRCVRADCAEGRIWLPPRCYCPDCLAPMEWVEAPGHGEIYTHTTVEYPGSNFKLSVPCPLISVAIDGVGTKLMSYLREGRPEIGMRIKAWFNTERPTNTILDLAWVPE